MKNSEFEKVFEGKHFDANHVKNLLEAHQIPAFLKDDAMGQLFPLFVTHGGLHPVKVYVTKEKYEEAKDLIDSYFST
jgi:hypothetical protein